MGPRLSLLVACSTVATLLTIPAFAQTALETAGGPPVCVKCHKEAYERFSLTKHAVRGDPRTPFGTGRDCQACHGDATEHLKNPVKNPIPQRFQKQGPADAQNQVCLTCHQGGKRIHWQGSM